MDIDNNCGCIELAPATINNIWRVNTELNFRKILLITVGQTHITEVFHERKTRPIYNCIPKNIFSINMFPRVGTTNIFICLNGQYTTLSTVRNYFLI